MKIFKIGVVFTLDNGESITGQIDVDESFIPDLNLAIRNSKDPISALTLLADIGSRHLDTDPIAVKNRIGDFVIGGIKIEAAGVEGFKTIIVGSTEELNKKVTDIWDNPESYYDCRKGEDAFIKFLKYLWIKYPEGSEKRFMEYAIEELRLE